MKKLSEIIKEFENNNLIDNYYTHYNWGDGSIELNIEFVSRDPKTDELLKKYSNDLPEKNQCAFWE